MDDEVAEIGQKILNFLEKNYPKDFSIQEIADELKIHRNSVSTHIRILQASKHIKLTRKLGTSKLFTIKK